MTRILIIAALLAPTYAFSAELWCMPDTICRFDGSCLPSSDEESSVRLADMSAQTTTLRTHAEDVALLRRDVGASTEWQGLNAYGAVETLIWTLADMTFVYTITASDGATRKATGQCEVQ